MEITIKKQEKKPLLLREEIEAVVISNTTPSNVDVKKEISEKLKKSPDVISIKGIYKKFGSREIKILAYAYESSDILNKFEKVKKEKKGQEGQAEQKAQPEKKAEAKAEQKTEVKPAPAK